MFKDTIEVLAYPTIRDRGRDVPDYTQEPTGVAISGVDLQPGPSTELVAQRREATSVRWTVYVPHNVIPDGTEITRASIVRVRGQRYQVDGDPLEWGDGSDPLDHLVVALVSWEPRT